MHAVLRDRKMCEWICRCLSFVEKKLALKSIQFHSVLLKIMHILRCRLFYPTLPIRLMRCRIFRRSQLKSYFYHFSSNRCWNATHMHAFSEYLRSNVMSHDSAEKMLSCFAWLIFCLNNLTWIIPFLRVPIYFQILQSRQLYSYIDCACLRLPVVPQWFEIL